jgi:hypothetical protein
MVSFPDSMVHDASENVLGARGLTCLFLESFE